MHIHIYICTLYTTFGTLYTTQAPCGSSNGGIVFHRFYHPMGVSPRKTPEMNPTCAEELGRRSPSAKWPPEIAERFEAKWRAMKHKK